MRAIGVVTVARSDYGIYLPILRALQATADLKLNLLVSGMHLSPEFGLTVSTIRDDGFPISDEIVMLLSSDTPEGIAKSVGLGVTGFAQSYRRGRPDLLLVLGDRFEMLSAVVASLPFSIPIAHIHGGEATEGLIDEPIRHAMTKMSHLHFVSTERYARRVIQMGEEPWRVKVSGAPSLDNLKALERVDDGELARIIGLPLTPAPLLVTFHPVTLEYRETPDHIRELMTALDALNHPVVFTYPNADTSGRMIIEAIDAYVREHDNAVVAINLGTRAYFSLMSRASAMVGNSSSGIIEAASFGLPVVNIGNRQRGRVHGQNVLDVACDKGGIVHGIQRALEPGFKRAAEDMDNPYGDGNASSVIVNTLRDTRIDKKLLLKQFHDIGEGA